MTIGETTWTSGELLERNRDRLIKELRRKVHSYEAQYETSSGQVEAQLANGQLRDTAEICDWVIAFHTLSALEDE